jgi:hypothetical protein
MSSAAKARSPGFYALPRAGAWRFLEQQAGFEVARFETRSRGAMLWGTSVGMEAGQLWSLRYVIRLDARWCARSATIESDLGQRLTVRADAGAGS